MHSPELLLALVAVVAIAFFASGSWILHSRIRSSASRALFLSVIAFPLWVPVSIGLNYFLQALYRSNDMRALNALSTFIVINWLAISLITISSAVSFWLTVRSIGQRPNNSFKPKPLRGSA